MPRRHGERASAERWRTPCRRAREASTPCVWSGGEPRGLHRGCGGGRGKEEGGRDILGESREDWEEDGMIC